jgi:hypothetical protein
MKTRNSNIVGLALGVGLTLMAGTLGASAGTVVLQDGGTFGSPLTVAPSGGYRPTGVTVSVIVCPLCGDPGTGLLAIISNASYGGSLSSGIGVLDSALTYNPSTGGAIISLDASSDKLITVSSGPFVSGSFRILLEQGGNYYTDAVDPMLANGSFQSFSASGLTATDFKQICLVACGSGNFDNPGHLGPDSPVALNFVNGGMIEFGVVFQAAPAIGVTDTAVFDNLDFTLTTTPLPAALPLFATGLGGLGLLGWRRKRKNTAAVAA